MAFAGCLLISSYAMKDRIPFNRPQFAGPELEYITKALASGWLSGDGTFTRRCHDFLETSLGVKRALLTTSCTHALEMAAILLNIEPADEVILPSFTFVSTANAFVLRGAKPVFVDIRFDTFNMDERLLECAITKRTKAIVPVHYSGVGCEMETICAIAEKHNLAIVEDNAHGLFAKYKGKLLGSFGAMATQSFHETKNFQCGEGGALLINDNELVERAEIVREKGTNRKQFFQGQVDKYSWVDLGSSYLPSEVLAAILFAQFENRENFENRRKLIWQRYADELHDWAEKHGVRLPQIPEECSQSHHIFHLLMPSQEDRNRLIEHLKAEGIGAVYHYVPLHSSSMGRRLSGVSHLPVTDFVSDRLVRLPLYSSLSADDQQRVIFAVQEFRTKDGKSSVISQPALARLSE